MQPDIVAFGLDPVDLFHGNPPELGAFLHPDFPLIGRACLGLRLAPPDGGEHRFHLGEPGGDVTGFQHRPGLFKRGGKPVERHRLQHIVYSTHLKGLNRIMVERGHKYHHRRSRPAQRLQHIKAVQARHLYIEQNHIGLQRADQRHGFIAVLRLPGQPDARQLPQDGR